MTYIIDGNNALDKLFNPYIGNKLTQVVRRNKTMTLTSNKLKKIYANF